MPQGSKQGMFLHVSIDNKSTTHVLLACEMVKKVYTKFQYDHFYNQFTAFGSNMNNYQGFSINQFTASGVYHCVGFSFSSVYFAYEHYIKNRRDQSTRFTYQPYVQN